MRLIGVIPTGLSNGRLTINQDYPDAVYRAGGLPVLLSPAPGESETREALARLDGLLLTGGEDVDPRLYGEEKLPCCGEISPERDRMDFLVCRLALARNLPMLAICRGLQVLNCVLGGTLYQDIETQVGKEIVHPRSDTPADPVHEALVEKDSLLFRLTGEAALDVNSRHHQKSEAKRS